MVDSTDLWLLQAVYAASWGPIALDIVRFVTFLGSGWMLLGVIPFLFLSRLRAPTATLLLTLSVTSGVVAAIKTIAGRVRPCHAYAFVHALPIDFPTDPSFPSGHAAGSFAFAAFIFASHRRAGLALTFVASLVALSRVALGVHYPSDVAAGAVLGTALGWAGARLTTVGGLTHADPEALGQ